MSMHHCLSIVTGANLQAYSAKCLVYLFYYRLFVNETHHCMICSTAAKQASSTVQEQQGWV